MKSTAFLPLVLVPLLAACGGGGGSSGPDVMTFAEIGQRRTQLLQRFDDSIPTTQAQLLRVGTAEYTGVARIDEYVGVGESGLTLFAEAQISADFAGDEGSGRLTNFRTRTDEQVAGAITLTGTSLIDGVFEADLGGSLTLNAQSRPVSGSAEGQFYGRQAQGIEAEMALDIGGRPFSGHLIGSTN